MSLRTLSRGWGLAAFLFVMIVGTIAAVYATERDNDVPFPFDIRETRFDLADGETYMLLGTVVVQDSVPYLDLDLKEQTWLATEARKANSLIKLDTKDNMGSFVGKKVMMRVKVKADQPECLKGHPSPSTLLPLDQPRLSN